MSLLFFGSMASQFPFQSIYGVLKAIPPFIFARSLIMELTKNEDFLSKIIMALKIACLTGVFFIVMQMTIGLDFTFYEALNSNVSGEGQLRYPGFFPDSQFSGVYLSMLSFLFLLNLKDPKKPTVVNYVSFGLVVLAIILAGSRSAMLGFGAGLFLLIVFVGGRFRITAILFGTAVAVVVGIFANSFVIFRRFGEMDDSISFRQTIWRGAYDIFKDNYLLGIGVSNYRAYVSLHAQDQFLMLENEQLVYLDQPENGYLKLLVEFGLLGFITLFAIVLGPIIKLFITFLQGRKKVISGFFFVAPLICLFLSFSSLYTLSDSRIVILLCCFVAFLITYPSDYQPAHEI
jgi:O-antigen ligase